jgi:hypothetical protein
MVPTWAVSPKARKLRRQITMRFAPPRASRAPEYTALMTRVHVNDLEEVWRGMADGRSCLAPRREPLNVI